MKKKILNVVLLLLISTVGFSQVELKFNPVAALFGQVAISGEYIIQDNIGAEVTLGYSFSDTNVEETTSKYSGIVTNFLFKYYFSPEKGGDKFYAFPYLRYVKRSWTVDNGNNNEVEANYSALGFGFGAGYKVVAETGLLFDIGLGVGKNFNTSLDYSDDTYDPTVEYSIPINFIGRISVGYRF